MKTLTVILIDKNNNVIERYQCEGLKEAKAKARYLASEEWARVATESTHTHADLGSDRVEVTDEGDYVVFDLHVQVKA